MSKDDILLFTKEDLVELFLEQQAALKKALSRLKELEDEIAKNSQNSSHPPSKDDYKKPKPKSERKKNDKASGGQAGHKGNTLKQAEPPDIIETHSVLNCSGCGTNLENVEVSTIEERQEFEIPLPKVVVTAHRAEVKICPCCKKENHGTFPEAIQQPVQYGVQLKAMSVYFSQYQLLPYGRLQEIFRYIFCVPLSQGTLVTINDRCYTELAAFETTVKAQLQSEKGSVNFDESGLRVQTRLNWLHVAATAKLTHYAAHPKRGLEAMNFIGILSAFKGRAIHDFWKPYLTYRDCQHGLCNAHHLRELRFHEEQNQQSWCTQMKAHLLLMHGAVRDAKEQGLMALPSREKEEYEARYRQLLVEGLSEIPVLLAAPKPKRGKAKQHPAKNLWDRLSEYEAQVLAFLHDFSVPFTNNQAEQDIRMIKVKQKISGTFRTRKGADVFCRIRSYLSTCKKQAQPLLASLSDAFEGNPFSLHPAILSLP
jgi:transposase